MWWLLREFYSIVLVNFFNFLTWFRRLLFPRNPWEKMASRKGVCRAFAVYYPDFTQKDWDNLSLEDLWQIIMKNEHKHAEEVYKERIGRKLQGAKSVFWCHVLYQCFGYRWGKELAPVFCARISELAKSVSQLVGAYDHIVLLSDRDTLLQDMLYRSCDERDIQFVLDRAHGDLRQAALEKVRELLSVSHPVKEKHKQIA